MRHRHKKRCLHLFEVIICEVHQGFWISELLLLHYLSIFAKAKRLHEGLYSLRGLFVRAHATRMDVWRVQTVQR